MGICWRQEYQLSGQPCTSSTSGPLPASATRRRMPLVATVSNSGCAIVRCSLLRVITSVCEHARRPSLVPAIHERRAGAPPCAERGPSLYAADTSGQGNQLGEVHYDIP